MKPNLHTFTFEPWEYSFNAAASSVWSFLSDTNQMNRILGIPKVKYNIVEGSGNAGRQIYAEALIARFIKVKWLEDPFEWRSDHFYKVNRTFTSGLLSQINIEMELVGGIESQTIVKLKTSLTAKTKLIKPLVWIAMQVQQLKWKKYCKLVENALLLSSKKNNIIKPDTLSQEALLWIGNRLSLHMDLEKLTDFFKETSIDDLISVRPSLISDYFKINDDKALSLCFELTLLGVLKLEFRTICPHCHGETVSTQNLNQLPDTARCETCQLDFLTQKEDSFEAVFKVSNKLHTSKSEMFCLGSPSRTKHIDTQIFIKKGEQKTLVFTPFSKNCELRSVYFKKPIKIDFDNTEMDLTSEYILKSQISSSEASIELKNIFDHDLIVSVVNPKDPVRRCSLGKLSQHPQFRKHFNTQLLRADQSVSLENVTLLFTDLKGSTAMYEANGDAEAYVQIQNHFDILFKVIADNQGAVVKTIGDAVMAVFESPLLGVLSAIQMQRLLNQKLNLKLKIGLHTGPAYLVTQNGKLDYFGHTVNLAARTEGQCLGSDIVVTETMFQDVELQNWLKHKENVRDVEFSFFSAQLKGLSQGNRLVRIKPLPVKSLRLVA